MKRKILVALGIVVVLLAAPAVAPSRQQDSDVQTRVDRVDLADWGIYKTEVVRTVDAPESISGSASGISRRDTELVTGTENIPAALGTLFGFRYTVVGEPRNRRVPLRLTVQLPDPEGRPNPDHAGRTITHTLTPPISKKDFVGFGFQTKDEQVPGIWTFRLYYGDQLMAERTFTVFLPDKEQPGP